MAYSYYPYKSWVGGQAIDKKVGVTYSFANSQSLDFRKSPSQMSVLPGTRREDNNTVQDLVQNEVMTADGTIYALGSNGFIYKRSSTGVWSTFGNVPNGAFGINYRQDQDSIYITSTTVVSSITTVSTAPILNGSYYGPSLSTYDNSTQTTFNVNSNQLSGNKTTTIGTTYVEGAATQLRYFQTDINPITSIGVNIITKGTGNWTMVVHDGLGNQLGTSTITNSNLVSSQVNFFPFPQIQVNVGPNNAQTYHWHLTSTVADGTISSLNAEDLSSADMQLYADRLVATTNGLHPMVTFQQFECIGNGRYLSVWEPLGDPAPSNSEWQRQKLSFPPGYEVCGLTVFNEYLVIATERTTTGDNTPQEGIIFYWDGLSDTYNYFTKIPEGSPQAIHEYENIVYYIAAGNWYAISSVAATPEKIRSLPGAENTYTSNNTQTKVYPYSATTRHGIQLQGWPSTTGNQTIPYGVYSWGKVDYTQPNSFGYSYILSTGDQFKTDTNNLTIGMVKNFGNILHISWLDNGEYGVDVIDTTSTPAPFSKWESLIEDMKVPTKDSQASYLEAHWLDIQDGVSIVLKYSINRGDWIYSSGDTSNAAGGFSNGNLWGVDEQPGYGRLDVGTNGIGERFFEFQIGVDIYCDSTVTSPPVIVGVTSVLDPLASEVAQ